MRQNCPVSYGHTDKRGMVSLSLCVIGVVSIVLRLFNRYSKRHDGGVWTKNTLLRRIFDEINNPELVANNNYNEWCINKEYGLFLTIGAANYSDKDKLVLVESFFFNDSKTPLTWVSLFDICKQYYGDKYRNLEIRKDEDFEKSRIKQECHDVYAPLLRVLNDPESLESAMQGNEFVLSGKKIQLRKIRKPSS